MLQIWQRLAFHEIRHDGGLGGRTVEATHPTTLNLLTPEGIVTCRFEGQLNAEQYQSLVEFVRHAETRPELEGYLMRFADKWRTIVMIEK
jgi:hypothetical protein